MKLVPAVLASLLLHGVLIGFDRRARNTQTDAAPVVDPWAGDTLVAPEIESMPSRSSPGPAPRAEPPTPPPPIAVSPPAPRAPVDEGEVHEPRPRPSPTSARPANIAPARRSSAPAASVDAPAAAAATGTFGADGPGGVRDLTRAFTRAIPAATSADIVWSSLPLGSAGSFQLAIVVNDDGSITSAEPVERETPTHLRNLARRTIAMLGSGRFALAAGSTSAGREILQVSVEISQGSAPAAGEAESGGAFGLGFEAPTPTRPGKAFFTLASGRHVAAKVKLVRIER